MKEVLVAAKERKCEAVSLIVGVERIGRFRLIRLT